MASFSGKFNKRSTAGQVVEGMDLTGKRILITGASSGLGLHSAQVLAERGAHVIVTARSLQGASEVCDQIGGSTKPLACELGDPASIRACAASVLATGEPLDVLMCNAGIMALPELTVKDGIELQFLTNHFGHFLLTNLLLEAVTAAPAGRVVITSSAAHMTTVGGGINFDNLNGADGYQGWRFYGQSKLANLLMASELADRLSGTNATAYSLHPGVIQTNLGRNMTGLFPIVVSLGAKFIEKTIPQGAATQCYLATAPEVTDYSGQYFSNCAHARTSPYGRDRQLAKQLWDVSAEFVSGW